MFVFLHRETSSTVDGLLSFQSRSNHTVTDLWSPIYRAVCIAYPVLNLASTHRSGFADFFSSLPSFFFFFSSFLAYLSSQNDARSIDQQGFFPPCLHPFETSTALSARPCTVCLLMETCCSIALKRNFFSWQVPGREGNGSLEWPFVIQWDTNHQGFTRVLCRVPRSKRYDLLSRKLLQITSFFLWFISSISKE